MFQISRTSLCTTPVCPTIICFSWSVPVTRPSHPSRQSCMRRPWHVLSVDALRAALSASQLDRLFCELTSLTRSSRRKTVTIRRRSSDPWFDQECRQTKRTVRRLERLAVELLAPLRRTQEATAARYSKRPDRAVQHADPCRLVPFWKPSKLHTSRRP